MKIRNIVLVSLLALGASAASFAATDTNALRQAITLTDNGNLNVTVVDGVATIFGYAHAIDIASAKRVAQSSEGIDSVIVTATSIN